MEKLLKILKENKLTNPYIFSSILKPKRALLVDLPCWRIEEKELDYGESFHAIIYVRNMDGFYIIPYPAMKPWFTDDNITNHPNYDGGVRRLFYQIPHLFRSIGRSFEDMEEYFYSPEKALEWMKENLPDCGPFPQHLSGTQDKAPADEWVPILEVPCTTSRSFQFGDTFKAVKFLGQEHAETKPDSLVRRVFEILWASKKEDVLKWRESTERRDYAAQIRKGDRPDGNKKRYAHDLDNEYYLYMNWYPRYNLEMLQAVLEDLGLGDQCFVKYAMPLEAIGEGEQERELSGVLKKIDEALARKNQVILYGPPGTGKTFTANEYVKIRYPEKEDRDDYVYRCTFHPEYGYEHFIEGHSPQVNGEGNMVFRRKDGVFKRLCNEALEDPEKPFYLIIDEINRGDIPRIFGELITLIEKDKRDPEHGVVLPHSQNEDDPEEEEGKFWVPPNVYLIATMNTADRSIALLDTALRRRFGFVEMKPDSSVLAEPPFNVPKSGTPLRKWFEDLNSDLQKNLEGRHDAEEILIGHSYFMMPKSEKEENAEPLTDELFGQIIRHDIIPLLREYCYEDKPALAALLGFIARTTGIDPDDEPGKKADAGDDGGETDAAAEGIES